MTPAVLEKLVRDMVLVEWDWDKSSVRGILSALGWTHRRDINHRSEFALDDQANASVYSHKEHVELVEITLDAFLETDSLDDLAYEDMLDEYYRKFKDATSVVERAIGRPDFCDGSAAPGFPPDQDAVWVSTWNAKKARIMIAQKHEDRSLPFRLCLIIAPGS